MPRPKKNRLVLSPPKFCDFKPCAERGRNIAKINLTLDEYEAIRLSDYENLDQEEAAKEMNISRPTYTRLIDSARKKTAKFIVDGLNLKIDGGNVHFKKNLLKCNTCGKSTKQCIKIDSEVCPNCNSNDVTNSAKEFGHIKCCQKMIDESK